MDKMVVIDTKIYLSSHSALPLDKFRSKINIRCKVSVFLVILIILYYEKKNGVRGSKQIAKIFV